MNDFIEKLLDDLRNAKEPSEGLDARICRIIRLAAKGDGWIEIIHLKFTSSIDDALVFVEWMLPGSGFYLQKGSIHDGKSPCAVTTRVPKCRAPDELVDEHGETLPIAICLAALKAWREIGGKE